MFTTTKLKTQKGFTTIELIFYVLGMTIVLSAIFYLIVNLYSFYKKISVESKVDNEAVIIMRRLTDDLRVSNSINIKKSILNKDNGSITMLQTVDQKETEKKYAVSDNRIFYQNKSADLVYLSPENILISKFYLEHFESPISEAVKIELGIDYESEHGSFKTKTYTNFIILRNSYHAQK